jgi:hypothetical protein
MASKVGIINLALTQIGSARIASVTEDSEQARKANAVYDLIRDEVMVAHPWNFAIDRTSLAVLDSTPEFDYDYQFLLPADCLRVLSTDTVEDDWEVAGDKILYNDDSINIKYIKKITDTTKYSPGFIQALAARLAAELAYPIADSRTLSEEMFKVYLDKLKIAKSQDAQESGDQYSSEYGSEEDWLGIR